MSPNISHRRASVLSATVVLLSILLRLGL